MSRKIISFSVYGDDADYHRGALGNLAASKVVYPGWICRFYVSQEIPESVIDELHAGGAEVIRKVRTDDADGMFWRFLPAAESDIDILIVRDVDAILSSREKHAVDDWLASGKEFHIIRDMHKHRSLIMGGLWGCRPNKLAMLPQLISEWSDFSFGGDQRFLNKHVYPRIQDNVMIHTDFTTFEGETVTRFPVPRDGTEWLGMPVFRQSCLKARQKDFAAILEQEPRSFLQLVSQLPLARSLTGLFQRVTRKVASSLAK